MQPGNSGPIKPLPIPYRELHHFKIRRIKGITIFTSPTVMRTNARPLFLTATLRLTKYQWWALVPETGQLQQRKRRLEVLKHIMYYCFAAITCPILICLYDNHPSEENRIAVTQSFKKSLETSLLYCLIRHTAILRVLCSSLIISLPLLKKTLLSGLK